MKNIAFLLYTKNMKYFSHTQQNSISSLQGCSKNMKCRGWNPRTAF